jgi:hypothetical protein
LTQRREDLLTPPDGIGAVSPTKRGAEEASNHDHRTHDENQHGFPLSPEPF